MFPRIRFDSRDEILSKDVPLEFEIPSEFVDVSVDETES